MRIIWKQYAGPFLILLLLPVMGTAFPIDLEKIALAIESGNANKLSQYFDNSVEITILKEEEVYSQSQAKMVLKNFFDKHEPSSFDIIHKGSSNKGSEYCIGTLVANDRSFRTYIYVKQKGESFRIQEIRFEED